MPQPENQQTSQSVPPQVAIMQMATGYWVSQSIYAAAKLGIADLLKDGPKSYDELATATAVKARPLYRLLRGLASVGVFSETEPGYFTLTPLAACLQTDITGSMRAVVTILGEEEYQAWGQYGSDKSQAVLRIRKVGGSSRLPVPLWKGFFEGNFDTRFLTTRGLLLCDRSGNNSSKISAVNQKKKGETLLAVTAGT